MRNWWIKFGCFLTGYNYGIVRSSSEVVAKMVKRYTSALLIVGILWFFVGFMFTRRYMYGTLASSITGAIMMVIIIIQIERQIILSVSPGKLLYWSRGTIAVLMAIIGSIVIDQIIFKDDIELEKITFLDERVAKALPPRTMQLREQLLSLDTVILKKDTERTEIIDEVTKMPFVKSTTTMTVPTKVTSSTIDSSTGRLVNNEKIVYTTNATTIMVPNPKGQLIQPLDQTLAGLRRQKSEKENALLNIRPELEKEIRSKTGFLEELEVMYRLITGSRVALGVWLMWFLFLMGLEMLVLFGKMSDKKNDYDETIKHQMDLQIKKLEVLARHVRNNSTSHFF
ncbi:MAG TPA: DUF4407 domain-containing protein [Puia sp.]|nr:DUF4407 domain-containing protein [Puia sp.]